MLEKHSRLCYAASSSQSSTKFECRTMPDLFIEPLNLMDAAASSCELTILMPCLNESETLATCVAKAIAYLERSGVHGEVLIADSGSIAGSQAIAIAAGARVVPIAARGYGSALLGGIQ